jgi:hypothetical protein
MKMVKTPIYFALAFMLVNIICCRGHSNDDALARIVNPHNSTCYDWRGEVVPCEFKRQYAELLLNQPIPISRFVDNKDGTFTDNLTGLIWLKNANCSGMMSWENAILVAKSLKEGNCGANPALALADRSSAGDWRLPTMDELCTLIDFSRRDPALPDGHFIFNIPSGYHWSVTTLGSYSELAWIVYIESGTTCYENIKNRAGYVLPVRSLKQN